MTQFVITKIRSKRIIRGIMSISSNSNDSTIKLNLIFPTPYEDKKNQGAAKPINKDIRLFAKSIGTEILKILEHYKFEIKPAIGENKNKSDFYVQEKVDGYQQRDNIEMG